MFALTCVSAILVHILGDYAPTVYDHFNRTAGCRHAVMSNATPTRVLLADD